MRLSKSFLLKWGSVKPGALIFCAFVYEFTGAFILQLRHFNPKIFLPVSEEEIHGPLMFDCGAMKFNFIQLLNNCHLKDILRYSKLIT